MAMGGGVGGEVIVGGADGGGSGTAREPHSDVSIARPALKQLKTLPVVPAAGASRVHRGAAEQPDEVWLGGE